jgi:acyl-CoA-binding protein
MMANLIEQFEIAAREAQNLSRKPDNQTLLQLYAYYKQATAGDVSGKRPGITDMRGQAKFDAWKKTQGMSKEAAMQAYIDLVARLKG